MNLMHIGDHGLRNQIHDAIGDHGLRDQIHTIYGDHGLGDQIHIKIGDHGPKKQYETCAWTPNNSLLRTFWGALCLCDLGRPQLDLLTGWFVRGQISSDFIFVLRTFWGALCLCDLGKPQLDLLTGWFVRGQISSDLIFDVSFSKSA